MNIRGWHIHVYYDAQSMPRARQLCERAAAQFPLSVGHMHQRPVGPHPDWSCQLSIGPELFGEVLPWLLLNRDGLTLFSHPVTGDDLADHRDHAVWIGQQRPLNLSIFG